MLWCLQTGPGGSCRSSCLAQPALRCSAEPLGACCLQGALLVGGPGTAKTTVINQFLSRFNPEEASSKTITFSYLTTPQIFQMSVEVSLKTCAASPEAL